MDSTSKINYRATFANKLGSLLKKNPKTGEPATEKELGKAIGKSQQAINQWANGTNAPKIEHLKPMADFFGITIDELVTGVSCENEELHIDTGLFNENLEILKRHRADNKIEDKIIIEFINAIISSTENMPRLAMKSVDYLIGVHKFLLWKEDVLQQLKDKIDFAFLFNDEHDMQSNDIDFQTHMLTKAFENHIKKLATNSKIVKQMEKIYVENGFDLPNYTDRQFEKMAEYYIKYRPLKKGESQSDKRKRNPPPP